MDSFRIAERGESRSNDESGSIQPQHILTLIRTRLKSRTARISDAITEFLSAFSRRTDTFSRKPAIWSPARRGETYTECVGEQSCESRKRKYLLEGARKKRRGWESRGGRMKKGAGKGARGDPRLRNSAVTFIKREAGPRRVLQLSQLVSRSCPSG